VSQPADRRTPRHRLSATSTITEQRVNDSKDHISLSTPTEPHLEEHVGLCDGRIHHQAHCDHESTESIRLHISESSSDSEDSNRINNNKLQDLYSKPVKYMELEATNKGKASRQHLHNGNLE